MTALLLAALGLGAGVLGALLGVGGGILVVPVLSQGFDIPFRHAVGVSLVVIIASSSASAASLARLGVLALFVTPPLRLAVTASAFFAPAGGDRRAAGAVLLALLGAAIHAAVR